MWHLQLMQKLNEDDKNVLFLAITVFDQISTRVKTKAKHIDTDVLAKRNFSWTLTCICTGKLNCYLFK